MGAECEKVKPDAACADDKASQVRRMFDHIAPAYDFMNRAMTLGIDRLWRRKAVAMVRRHGATGILDAATAQGLPALSMSLPAPAIWRFRWRVRSTARVSQASISRRE